MDELSGVAPDARRSLPSSVLIVGCGDVGTAVGTALAAAGVVVHGLRRDPSVLPGVIRPVAADFTDPNTLTHLPVTDAVVFSASPAGRDEAAYRDCYLTGPANVLDALPGQPTRAVLTSTTAVYGQTDGSDVDEDSPTTPRRDTARTVLAGESALRERLGADLVTLRIAGIYGPGRLRLVRQVAAGEARCTSPDPWTNRVHRDDVATAAITALGLPRPAPTYVVVDDAPTRRCEVLNWLADQLGVQRPHHGGPGRSRGGDKRCRNDLLRATGWRPRHPDYRSGYEPLLAGFAR